MKSINTRKWSTPIIIGSGLFVAISGVLMFFGIRHPLEQAHELIGIVFAISIILHVLNHWQPFRSYFNQRYALSIIAGVMLVTLSLVVVSLGQGGGTMMNIIHRVEGAPLTELAPILDQNVEALLTQFEASGFVVDDTEKSIVDIASSNNVEPKALMQILFN